MRSLAAASRVTLLSVVLGCSSGALTASPSQPSDTPAAASHPAGTDNLASLEPDPSAAHAARPLLFDTDVAADDLVALAFLLASPQVDLAAVTVSGTGEAHCAAGVDVVLRLLDRLDGPGVPVACGRETPLAGSHEFPSEWREHVDRGSGLDLPRTTREPSASRAIDLIVDAAAEHPDLIVLATGPLTNLADALLAAPELAGRLGAVFVMGGALHVPGNLVCCGAPEGNAVAEWNIYIDPRAAQVVVESGVRPAFVSLDGTNLVPVTGEFARRVAEAADSPHATVFEDLFAANPHMTAGGYSLWDPLAAELAAGYPVGSFSPAAIVVEEAEGPESGFTRPMDGVPNITYLSKVDPAVAEDTLLRVLGGG